MVITAGVPLSLKRKAPAHMQTTGRREQDEGVCGWGVGTWGEWGAAFKGCTRLGPPETGQATGVLGKTRLLLWCASASVARAAVSVRVCSAPRPPARVGDGGAGERVWGLGAGRGGPESVGWRGIKHRLEVCCRLAMEPLGTDPRRAKERFQGSPRLLAGAPQWLPQRLGSPARERHPGLRIPGEGGQLGATLRAVSAVVTHPTVCLPTRCSISLSLWGEPVKC